MKIVVFGATGSIGKHVVREALAAGHAVRALVRDPTKMPVDDRVELIVGDLTDPPTVSRAVAGMDAVVWAAGASGNTADQVPIFESAARNLVEAMRANAVRRLVALSGAGITLDGERKPIAGRLMSALVKVAARYVYEAKRREYEVFTASDLDWTLVRPPRVVEGSPTGRVVVGTELVGRQVTEGDVAYSMVGQLNDAANVRAAPYVSSTPR